VQVTRGWSVNGLTKKQSNQNVLEYR